MRRGLLALAAVLALVMPPAVAARAQVQPPPPRSRMALTFQSPSVPAGGDFVVRLRVDRSVPSTAEVAVTVFRAVQTRSEFEQTLDDRITRPIALAAPAVPLSSLTPDGAGDVTVRVPVDLGTTDGVFPVRVDLRERGGSGPPLDRITTHLVYMTGSHTGPKLALSLILPLRGGMSLPSDGPRHIPDLEDLVASISALDGYRSLPFAIEPSPETLAALAATGDDRAERGLETLRRVATEHPVVSGPFVPVNLPSLVSTGLGEEVADQIEHGRNVLSEVLRGPADVRTWVETEPLDPESVDYLVRQGVERIIVAEPVLDPVPELNVTLSRPFVLSGLEEDVPALAADAGLTAHFNAEPTQVLQANHLLADLAVLWLDAPASDRRAVVAVAPTGWRANRPFLEALVNGLSQNPVVEPVPLDTIFTSVTPAVTGRGIALVRHPADVPASGLGEVVAPLRQARRRLTSLDTVLAGPAASATLLKERLLVAQSSELRGTRARQNYLDAVETGINDHLDAIDMPEGRSITLTARRGQIPVTFQNRTGSPVNVMVTINSDKLEFPQGTTRPLELARRNTTERFEVVALTSGAFPLRITLESPDGALTIGQARLTVRSTAASRVSVAVSVGALAFLAIWWGRHIVRGRRARRLVPV